MQLQAVVSEVFLSTYTYTYTIPLPETLLRAIDVVKNSSNRGGISLLRAFERCLHQRDAKGLHGVSFTPFSRVMAGEVMCQPWSEAARLRRLAGLEEN